MKNAFVFLVQILIICTIFAVSKYIVNLFHLPIPASIFGMVLLYLLLSSGLMPIRMIEKAGSFLNKHLAFFFIPFGVGLMSYGSLIKTSGWQLLLMIAGSSIIGLLMTSGTTQYLLRKEQAKNDYSNSNYKQPDGF